MVHASRREKPGQSEIHTKDADIIYVLEGKATIVTGGISDDAKNIAADELRGTSIRNGQTRQLTKGDVMVIPHGVPHQFVEVSNPFLYYVVKVRQTR
jgi:quercetin dioxygenase-like cupin family protein